MKFSRWTVAGYAVLGAALAVLFAYSLRVPAVQALTALHIWPQPEPFTELYFNTPLPQGTGATRLSFTIANHEGRAMNYAYVIYTQSRQDAAVLRSGSVLLQSGEKRAVEARLLPGAVPVPGEVFVQLPQLGEEIHLALPLRQQ